MYAIVCDDCHGLIATPTPGQGESYTGHMEMTVSGGRQLPDDTGMNWQHFHPRCWQRVHSDTPDVSPASTLTVRHMVSVPWE